MKYHVLSSTSDKLKLDYKTPIWIVPAIFAVVIILIGLPMAANSYGEGSYIFLGICLIGLIILILMLTKLRKKRPIIINYLDNTFMIDGKVIPFSDIKSVEVMSHQTFVSSGYVDKKFPFKHVNKKESDIRYFAVIITSDKTIRVCKEFKLSAKKQAQRFKAYLKLN